MSMRARSLQSRLTLCNLMDCSLPGSSIHEILQAKVLEWVTMPSSRGSFQPKDQTCSLVSPALAGGFFTTRDTWEAPTPSGPTHNSTFMLSHKRLHPQHSVAHHSLIPVRFLVYEPLSELSGFSLLLNYKFLEARGHVLDNFVAPLKPETSAFT